MTVQEVRLNPSVFGVGTVEARRSWMVGPSVAGRVLSVKVDVGDVNLPLFDVLLSRSIMRPSIAVPRPSFSQTALG
jgi:hypothetical protein